jgi:molybdopterin-guanine dinucleotide biosynthesis protein A
MTNAVLPPLTLLVLAGGRSTRMGQDKAWLELDGTPLIERSARRLTDLVSEVVFAVGDPANADDPRYAALAARLPVPARLATDLHPGSGPLAGLEAGLAAATNDLVFAVATDMPFVHPALVTLLVSQAEGYDAVIPLTPGDAAAEPEPLHAVYRRACLPAIQAALAAGRRRAVAFLADVHVRYVAPEELAPLDPQFRSFANINTPDEWARAGDPQP